MRHLRFKQAMIGALALGGFGLIGGALAVTLSPTAADVATVSVPATGPRPTTTTADPVKRASPAPVPVKRAAVPRFAHVVIVLEENESPKQVLGHAPYIDALARQGANFTNAYAETHPSEPNYLALFSGSTQGITDDSCPHTYTSANLGAALIKAGQTFAGYAESMPSDGYTGCTSGGVYARKHIPWVNFANVPASDSLRFREHFPSDYSKLPTVSFVTPNLCSDMHNCPIATGDAWLKQNLAAYASWAKRHDSLLIVTFDEAEHGVPNRIPLVMYGAHVKSGTYPQTVNHYSVLRTLTDAYGLACIGHGCDVRPITNAWN